MILELEIIRLSPVASQAIDYNLNIFRINVNSPSVDLNTGAALSVFLETIIRGGAQKIVIDLKAVQQMDSSGIGVFINAAKLLTPRNGEIAIFNIQPDIKSVLKTINLHKLVLVFNMEAEAMNHFRYL
jgi:anti-sigma B factor antagonist